jgi:hypothetical protein
MFPLPNRLGPDSYCLKNILARWVPVCSKQGVRYTFPSSFDKFGLIYVKGDLAKISCIYGWEVSLPNSRQRPFIYIGQTPHLIRRLGHYLNPQKAWKWQLQATAELNSFFRRKEKRGFHVHLYVLNIIYATRFYEGKSVIMRSILGWGQYPATQEFQKTVENWLIQYATRQFPQQSLNIRENRYL